MMNWLERAKPSLQKQASVLVGWIVQSAQYYSLFYLASLWAKHDTWTLPQLVKAHPVWFGAVVLIFWVKGIDRTVEVDVRLDRLEKSKGLHSRWLTALDTISKEAYGRSKGS